MPNEKPLEETQTPVVQGDAAIEPIDLAQAFKMLNQANREAAQADVAGVGSVEDTGSSVPVGSGDVGDGASIDEGFNASASDEPGDGADDDGSAGGIEAIDFNAYKQQMLRDIQNDSMAQVRKEFADQNIGYYSAAELTVRDEETGQVRFRNPDVQDERDPNFYFKSRAELQQFVESWNKGVDFEFRKAVNEKQRELAQQAAPTARLMDFLPKWQAMDDVTKSVFDDLLEGHEIRNAQGKEIGFNVDLDAVAAQAARIAKRFPRQGQQKEAPAQQIPASKTAQDDGPALDMKSGNGVSPDEKEPTNIGEALKMFDKKNKGGK